MSLEGRETPNRMKESTDENHNLQAGKNNYHLHVLYCKIHVHKLQKNQRKHLKNKYATLTADSCEMYCTQRSFLVQRENMCTLTLIS